MIKQSSEIGKIVKEQKKSKANFKIKFNISKILHNKNYFICRSQKLIIAYCITTRVKTLVHVVTDEYDIFLYPPYLFICAIGQYLYLYTQQSLNTQEIEKIKISKLQIKALCRYNNGFLMGGYNRSMLPGGKHTDKRYIYYIQELNKNQKEKTKPLKKIQIPKNKQPVTIITVQNPYLICFCAPYVYVLNIFTEQILLTLQKQVQNFFLLQGRFAFNTVNLIGISRDKKNIFTMDVERLPIFGVQVSEHEQICNSLCQSKEGHIFFCMKNEVWQYNPLMRQKKLFKKYQQTDEVIQVICTMKNTFLTVIGRKIEQKYETIVQVFHFQ